MKIKNKKALSAALAATLTSGVLSTAAHATANVDELYGEAYNATMKALAEKTQDSINVAREAISKLPKELDWAIGEFSKQVDTVQHPILVNIVDAINNAQKTEKQADINTARKAIPSNLLEVWKNSYSTAVDEVQQKLMSKTVEAIEAAKKSQKEEDIKAAQALIDDIKTVENNEGVKTWIGQIDKEFQEAIDLTVAKVEVLNGTQVEVKFNREIDKNTVSRDSFKAYDVKDELGKMLIEEVKVADDNKSVTVTFFDKLDSEKEYSIEALGVKTLSGAAIKENKTNFKYETAEVASVELNVPTYVGQKKDLKDYVVVKDTLGRNIVNEVELKYSTSDDKVVDANGITQEVDNNAIVVVEVVGKDGSVIAKSVETLVKVKANVSSEYQGFTIGDYTTETYSEVLKEGNITSEIHEGDTGKLTLFFKDQFGNEEKGNQKFSVERNYNPEVFIVDATGSIKTVAPGTGYVKVKAEDIEKTLKIEVKAPKKDTLLELDKTSIQVAKGSKVSNTITGSIKDQYGKVFESAAGTLTVQEKVNGQYAQADTNQIAATVTDGIITVDLKSALNDKKAGTYTFKLVYTLEDNKTLEKEFNVVVKESDNKLNNHELVLGVNTLDAYDPNKADGNASETELTVYELDSNGMRIKPLAVEAKDVAFRDAKGNPVTNDKIKYNPATPADATAGTAAKAANISVEDGVKEGSYKVDVKIGTLTKTVTITVKDSKPRATSVVVATAGNATVQDSKNVTPEELKAAISDMITVYDQFGKKFDAAEISDSDGTVYFVDESQSDEKVKTVVIKSLNVTVDVNGTKESKTIILPSPQVVKIAINK